MSFYSDQKKFFFAVDCVLFSYNDCGLNVLLSKRMYEPFKDKWSLVGGFVNENESAEEAANRYSNHLQQTIIFIWNNYMPSLT